MLTICTAAKPFRGHAAVMQRNALASWTKLEPGPEIILFGAEEGSEETARELGLRHVPEVARNRHGTPLLADILAQAEKHGGGETLAYVNADIILMQEFAEGIEKVRRKFAEFLAVGRRTNLEVREALEFHEGWDQQLRERLRTEGHLETPAGIDFFAFPRGVYRDVPPLAIGRVWFDQWFIKYARGKGLPVVDLTEFSPVAHQNHDYSHVPGGKNLGTYGGVEAEENLAYYGEKPHKYTILSATHELTPGGNIQRVRFRKARYKAKEWAWEVFIRRTARARRALGLYRKTAAGEKQAP